MEKKIKAVQLKKRIAVENIKSLERFQAEYSTDDAKQIPEALEDLEKHKEGFFAAVSKLEELDESDQVIEACIMERIDIEERCRKLKSFLREHQPKEEGSLNETTVQSVCVDKLTHLVDEFTRFINRLVKLKEPVDSCDTPLSNMLLMKLDRETLLAWEKHSVHFTKDKYKDAIAFVQDRIQILKSTNNF
uniref:Uncharacterized protein n=1 Tax=Anopheles quadriannulatus TaxID=34691 RepID=A0A182XPW0_ANOQN